MRGVLRLVLLLSVGCAAFDCAAQSAECSDSYIGYSICEDPDFEMLQRQMYRVGVTSLHPSMKHYRLDELNGVFSVDSVVYANFRRRPAKSHNVFRNLLWDDFLWFTFHGGDCRVAINPMFDLNVGKEIGDGQVKYVNSRGFTVKGNLGSNFWYYMDFSENQAVLPSNDTEFNAKYEVVAGQTIYKRLRDSGGFDYQTANGYIGFKIGRYLDFRLGKAKTFLGDGYRSLLLSDFAPSYPHLKMNATFGPVKYMFMMSQLRGNPWGQPYIDDNGTYAKYMFCHYLDVNLGRRFNLALFEAVTQCSWRVDGTHRGIEWAYVNPFIFFKPTEFDAGTPDKMLIGFNSSLKITDNIMLHGQFVLNEFRAKELFSGSDWWANKYGWLLGFRFKDIFRVDGLDFQGEVSRVRPYCYSQYMAMGCYTHQKQPLAHPLGANFMEGVAILRYRHQRVYVNTTFTYAKYGDDWDDVKKTGKSYGKDPTVPSNYRISTYGIKQFQGNVTKLFTADMQASCLLNPKSKLNFTLGCRLYDRRSETATKTSNYLYCSLRWSLKSWYHNY